MYIKCDKCKQEVDKNSLYCIYCCANLYNNEEELKEKILNRDDGIKIALLSKIVLADKEITNFEEKALEEIINKEAKKYKEKNLKKIYKDIVKLEENNLKNINELCIKLLSFYDYSKNDVKVFIQDIIKFAIYGKNKEKLSNIISSHLFFQKENYKELLFSYMNDFIQSYELKELYLALLCKTLHKDKKSDIESLQNFINIFEVSQEEQKRFEEIFYLHKDNIFDIKALCDKLLEFSFLKYELSGVLKIFVRQTILVNNLNERNKKILNNIAQNLNFTQEEFKNIINELCIMQSHKKEVNLKDSYEILGIEQNSSNEEIFLAYKKLINEYHPDKLKQKGLNDEFINFANEKLKSIILAFKKIKKERGIN